MSELKRSFKLHVPGLPDDGFEVLSFQGVEKISQLFRFDLDLVSHIGDVNFDTVLSANVWLGIRKPVQLSPTSIGYQTLKIHGVFSSFEQIDGFPGWSRYRGTLVPSFWRLSLGFQSQIHQTKTTRQIVEAEFAQAAAKYQLPDGVPFEFQLEKTDYPERDYVVQYLESDLNFIQRRCEHDGIFYLFLQEGSNEQGDMGKVLFTDSNTKCPVVMGAPTVTYLPAGASGAGATGLYEQDAVTSFTCRQNVIPNKVVLQDYNWRTPGVLLKTEADVESNAAFATFYEFGDHYKDEPEGAWLAQVRAQEIRCRKKVFVGTGTAKCFRAGYTFTLAGHPRSDFNTSYLLTEVRHRGEQPMEYLRGLGGSASYRNEFVAVPLNTPFRPERTTPKPRVAGTLTGVIDAAGDGQYAEVNSDGCYKVKLPLDLSDASGGTASRWIRMAQPYAGGGMGMHFPLHKGTEVILLHQNGDPDRPIIAGAVPNADTTSQVTDASHSTCQLNTGGGNQMRIEDQDGNQRIRFFSPTASSEFGIGSAT